MYKKLFIYFGLLLYSIYDVSTLYINTQTKKEGKQSQKIDMGMAGYYW